MVALHVLAGDRDLHNEPAQSSGIESRRSRQGRVSSTRFTDLPNARKLRNHRGERQRLGAECGFRDHHAFATREEQRAHRLPVVSGPSRILDASPQSAKAVWR
jgi:hypothetical protein